MDDILLRLSEDWPIFSLLIILLALTQMTAETQVQLNEANTFIRQLVSQKLDIIIEMITSLRGTQGEIKDIQTFILAEMRGDNED